MTPTVGESLACLECLYDLRGLPSDGRCPECGSPLETSQNCDPALLNAGPALAWSLAVGALSLLALPSMIFGALAVVFFLAFEHSALSDWTLNVLTTVAAGTGPMLLCFLLWKVVELRWQPLIRLSRSTEAWHGLDSARRAALWLAAACGVELGLGLICVIDTESDLPEYATIAVVLLALLLGGVGVPVVSTLAINRAVRPLMSSARRDGWRRQLGLVERAELAALLLVGLWVLVALIALNGLGFLLPDRLVGLLVVGGLGLLALSRLVWLWLIWRFRQHLGRLRRAEP